ncbi:MAG TPA: radical SAM protein [Candidatus Margulisiibacteriota bacterium]|nr:radical SAM protein [Candidatus Margulisiibacteriota bacterium]
MLKSNYLELKKRTELPRLPFEGNIDLTYRCNNNCRHCWLRIPPDSPELKTELSFAEIRKIADQARLMGCRKWYISGGEPMLRADFADIFDYLTANCSFYSINTNGTLITPEIARRMKRKGVKMVALYGATAQVHDHITRNPGSYEATMRGFAYLKEANAGFMVQLIPMKDNYHQFQDMIKLAHSLSKYYRIGATWLYLSASGAAGRNREIMRQRLPPEKVVELDKPKLSYEEWMRNEGSHSCQNKDENGYLFSSCIANRRDFHIDPRGRMTFCCFIKDPGFRYDLRKGDFRECWEKFIPSLGRKIKITEEYKENCGSCNFRKDCSSCPAYAYLEQRRFDSNVGYLCAVARENRKSKEGWKKDHRRYFRIGGITIQVESDLPFNEATFHPKFKPFQTKGPSEDMVSILHHFSLPNLDNNKLGVEVYRKPPWAIYKNNGSWVYLGISPVEGDKHLHRVAIFNAEHTHASIYNDEDKWFLKNNLHSLTLFPTDQLLLVRILADRQGCFLHSCGVNFKGKGLLFVGHSNAGKSTMAKMLKGKAEILCDDRIIVRRAKSGFKIYGTWHHGDVPDVSAGSAPLRAIIFLCKAEENRLIRLEEKKEITKRILSCLIRPLVTVDWWDKTLLVVNAIVRDIPCYVLRFDKSGKALDLLRKL